MAHKYNYFDGLADMASYACEAANFMNLFVNDFNRDTLPNSIEVMHDIEHKADAKRHEIMTHLATEFLPPIERSDIADLSSTLDDIIDCIDDAMQHLYIYDVGEMLPECSVFSDLILKCTESVDDIAKEFHNFRKSHKLMDFIIKTNDLESDGDRLYSETMRRIYTSDMPNKDIFIWARIIASFEDCCDYCEEASNIFQSAIMKNS